VAWAGIRGVGGAGTGWADTGVKASANKQAARQMDFFINWLVRFVFFIQKHDGQHKILRRCGNLLISFLQSHFPASPAILPTNSKKARLRSLLIAQLTGTLW